MQFVDTHTHITDEAFAGEEEAVIERARKAGVSRMLLADTDSSERGAMYAAVKKHPGTLFPMLGLYPGSVGADWREELDMLERWLPQKPVAVGEIGLDYHYNITYKEEQKAALRAQFELAAMWDLPVNIHLRDAMQDFLEIVKDCAQLHLRGNLHAYSGSLESLKELQRYGDWRIGVGGVVTFKKAHLAEVVKALPLDRILLETDSPYMAPVPLRGTRNESSNIPLIAAKIAEIKGIKLETVAAATTVSAEELFRI